VSAEQSKGWDELEIDFRKRIDELNILFKNWIEDVQTMDVVSATGNLKVRSILRNREVL